MLELRSIAYHVAFFAVLAAFALVFLPAFLLPQRWSLHCMRAWARTHAWLLRVICGLTYEIRGSDNLPKDGELVASKHQSAWETLSFLHILPAPAMVLKKELLYLPFFGWYTLKFGHLWVDRSGGASGLKSLLRRAKAASARSRQVVIFPEGTRRAPGAPPAYQRGVIALYRELGTRCVPVALNSGLYWKRRDWRRRPGTIVVEFLEPIPPGLNGKAFLAEMERRIESAMPQLIGNAGPR